MLPGNLLPLPVMFPAARLLVSVSRRRPFYRLRKLTISGNVSRHESTVAPSKILLRDYQEDCIQSVVSHVHQGKKRLGISLATGSGKTVIFTQLIDHIKSTSQHASQTLILAHRQELVEQAARQCTLAYPNKTIDIEMGNMHATGHADITVASVQSITSRNRIAKFQPKLFKLVLVDEAHHIVAPGYMRVLEHFGLLHLHQDSPVLVGVSATFSRFDGLRLGAAIDHIVYHKDYVDMIGDNWLSDVIFTTVESTADISHVPRGATGDFRSADLSRAVNTHQINEITVRAWLSKAQGRKSTLAFCVDLDHVAGLTRSFRAHGVDARFVTGDTPKIERSTTLDQFRGGDFPVLINCGVFTEGTDVPNIDCVLLARPTKSRNLLVQMIGRGMRLHPGKENCHIIDMVSALNTGVVTTPTLFGLDPSEIIDHASTDDLRTAKDRRGMEQQVEEYSSGQTNQTSASQTVKFTDYGSVFDLLEDISDEKDIRAISRNAWVAVSAGRYILNSTTGGYLRIQRKLNDQGKLDSFEVIELIPLTFPGAKTPYRTPREIVRARTFADAVHAADTYASKKYPLRLISRQSNWRRQPPTEGQLIFLNKFRAKDNLLTSGSISKGKAADMITKIKHGARGTFAKVEADKRKDIKVRLKIEQDQLMRQRELVKVGPLSE